MIRLAVLAVALSAPALGSEYVLEWDPNPVKEQVEGYVVRQDGFVVAETTDTSTTVNTNSGWYCWSVSAVNAAGEGPVSGCGAQVPTAPNGVSVTVTIQVQMGE